MYVKNDLYQQVGIRSTYVQLSKMVSGDMSKSNNEKFINTIFQKFDTPFSYSRLYSSKSDQP